MKRRVIVASTASAEEISRALGYFLSPLREEDKGEGMPLNKCVHIL